MGPWIARLARSRMARFASSAVSTSAGFRGAKGPVTPFPEQTMIDGGQETGRAAPRPCRLHRGSCLDFSFPAFQWKSRCRNGTASTSALVRRLRLAPGHAAFDSKRSSPVRFLRRAQAIALSISPGIAKVSVRHRAICLREIALSARSTPPSGRSSSRKPMQHADRCAPHSLTGLAFGAP